MNWLRTVLSFAVVACISSMALRAESQVPVVRYRVAITPSSGADAEEIARILAATVRGRIEPYAEEGFVGFVVAANPSAAEILAHDPRVANVTVMASDSIATPPPSTRPSVVATEQRPTHIATNANELLLGPYAYDGSGNITEIGTSQDQFRYDAFGRLKTATVSGVAQDFSYDVYGNIESVTTNGSTATIGVDSATNRLKSSGTYNILGQYDAAGRMTGYLGRDTFIYDSLDMMKESVIQGQRKVYLYTASDERLASVVISGSAETTSSWTVRDIAGKVVRVYDKTMTGGERWWWKEDYIYREGKLLAAEVDTLAKTLHFHPDHLGTSRLITGNGGATIARHDYQPFGGEITAPNQDTERMKFTGHERDYAGALTSDPLDYMHARYYSSSMGRFLTVDPVLGNLLQPQSWNRYAYVMNNPMNFIDPLGLTKRNPGEKVEDGDTCDGKIIDGWCTAGEVITVTAKAPSIDWVSMTVGVGDGIIGTLSFGLVSGHELRKLTGADQVVDRCSEEYLGGRVAGTVITLAAYAYGAIPSTLTHFTTRAGAAAIEASGTVLPSTGLTLFGDGVYATAGSRIFVPAASTVPVTVAGQGFIRIVPNAVFLNGGSLQTAAIFAGYGAAANHEAIGNPECN